MSSWRSRILGEFTPGVAPVTLVADPDGLLLEEGVLTDIHEQGFEIVPFEDPIAFRYAYESGFLERQPRPVPHAKAALLSETWAAVGLRADGTADELHRIDRLIEAANEAIPEHDERHDRWFHFAALWAELGALTLDSLRRRHL